MIACATKTWLHQRRTRAGDKIACVTEQQEQATRSPALQNNKSRRQDRLRYSIRAKIACVTNPDLHLG
jgi:hypothetical protein